jgi:hypothetical protein
MRPSRLLLVAVFLCVVGAHVWTIWMAPNALSFSVRHVHTDNAVILMMAKHILEKREFPIFYYGQDWFGSLSAVVHAAVFFLLGGIPSWSIHVAPLLFFLGFAVVQYRLTRDTLGPTVALWALFWSIVLPVRLAEYATMPHGGYIEGLMLGTVVLWLSVRLARAPGGWRKRGYYAALGLVGGLAWWTSPLVIYQLLASGAYVLLRERGAALVWGTCLTLPAFVIGAAPFIWFYATDPYSSVANLRGGFTWDHVPAGLYLLFTERLPDYLDGNLFRRMSPLALGLAVAVYAGSTLFFLWRLRRSLETRHPLRDAAIFPIFFIVFTLLFAASSHIRRDSPQYVLPLSAVFPVALGFSLVHAPGAWMLVARGGCAALFVLHGWTTTAWVVRNAPRAERATEQHLDLIRSLESRGVERFYTKFPPGSELLNFYSRERILASELTGERYAPNLEALEGAPDAAFFYRAGADDFRRTFGVLGGAYEAEAVGPYDLIRQLREVDRTYRQVSPVGFQGSASHAAAAMNRVADRNMETAWSSGEPKRPGMWVELDLGKSIRLGMVRLWNKGQHHGNHAMDIRVETSVDGRAWREVVQRTSMAYYYWSGPRLYPWEWGFRWEARFAPVEARRVRITQFEDGRSYPWLISEAYVYEDLGRRPPGQTGEKAVLQRIRALELDRVYADRWMSARIREVSRGRIETVTPFTVAIPQFAVRVKSRVVQWTGRPGFVLEDADADEFQRMIAEEAFHRLTREDFGRWVLFRPDPLPGDPDSLDGDPGWWWNGLGVVATVPREKSRYLTAMAHRAFVEGRLGPALTFARGAVDAHPFNRKAGEVLIQVLNAQGRPAEAVEEARKLNDVTEPRVKASAAFDDTLELLGYTMSSDTASPGQDVKVRYFWKVKRDPGSKPRIGVIVHVRHRNGGFIGDHPFLEGHEQDIWPVLEDEVFVQDHLIRVPKDAAPGTYRMLVGVQDLGTGKRWKVSASERAPRRDLVPVGVLRVAPSEAR